MAVNGPPPKVPANVHFAKKPTDRETAESHASVIGADLSRMDGKGRAELAFRSLVVRSVQWYREGSLGFTRAFDWGRRT